jgi:2-polyprenyl-6-methoxyphenol hydroxylase-like FAD-dependent oxidoreductase
MKPSRLKILVVGAGAAGLSFALECAHRGISVRIIEKRLARVYVGKATGVSLGAWRLLEKYGISPDKNCNAIPMKRFAFYDDEKVVAEVELPKIYGMQPAYLYPQVELEKILENKLSELGVDVEYGSELGSLESCESGTVRIISCGAEIKEIESFDWIIGADGAHSSVRNLACISFPGKEYREQWSVAEICTGMWPANEQAQLHLKGSGVGLFLSQPSFGNVQGIQNGSGVGLELAKRFPDSKIVYERDFRVSLRRVATPRKGRVWLIGDAAHVQSPVGGQGLNLAIWDGLTLAKSLILGDLSVERRLAFRAYLVLHFTHFDYKLLSTRSRLIQFLRNRYWSYCEKRPLYAKWFFHLISGAW